MQRSDRNLIVKRNGVASVAFLRDWETDVTDNVTDDIADNKIVTVDVTDNVLMEIQQRKEEWKCFV